MGIGFDTIGIPIDILPIYLLHSFLDNFSLLVVDEFLKINGTDNIQIQYGRNKLADTIEKFHKIYGFETPLLLCSKFMRSKEYITIFQDIKQQIEYRNLTDKVLRTLPENKKHFKSARDYPIHELACVQYLISQGFQLKIGPTKEKQYDEIMSSLNFNISFAYILDAYALGTKTADKVVHYIPTSRGPNNGQRIFLEDDERKVKIKLEQGCNQALRYFCKIASVSGHLLGLDYYEQADIESLYGKKLKRETTRLVIDNIVRPYQNIATPYRNIDRPYQEGL